MILRPYPLHCLQDIGSDFARCVIDTLQTKEALVGPIVLSAMSAAVHGSLDINTPMHRLMPASLYTTVVAGSGLGKTATTNYAYHGFREFEAKCVGSISPKDGFVASNGHPYRIDDASEAGLVTLFSCGAKAIALVLDEGGLLAKHLDYPRHCKRYDGDDLRFNRKHDITLVRDTRTTFCMTIQDAVFEDLRKGKQGPLLVPSGFIPRILLSFATDSLDYYGHSLGAGQKLNPNLHSFHDRVRELMDDYRDILETGGQRCQIRLSSEAEHLWSQESSAWKALPRTDDTWIGMEPFIQRAGEHALRIAAVLQWFADPKEEIGLDCMQSAWTLVDWHLEQALMGFGAPSEDALQIRLGNELHAYLLRKLRSAGQGTFMRVDLLRKGPANLRKAADLDLAIDQLLLENKLVPAVPGTRKQLTLNITPNFVVGMLPNTFGSARRMTDFLKF